MDTKGIEPVKTGRQNKENKTKHHTHKRKGVIHELFSTRARRGWPKNPNREKDVEWVKCTEGF